LQKNLNHQIIRMFTAIHESRAKGGSVYGCHAPRWLMRVTPPLALSSGQRDPPGQAGRRAEPGGAVPTQGDRPRA
jgi:hypothetical protein